MKSVSLKERILNYLKHRPNLKINGGEIEVLSLKAGYKASNGSRRCRDLRMEGKIKAEEINGSVWYWYEKPLFSTDPELEKLFN